MAFVEKWSETVTTEIYLKYELTVFVKITYFLSGLYEPKTRRFFNEQGTRTEQDRYISLITASYIDAPKDLARLGDTGRTPQKSFRQYMY